MSTTFKRDEFSNGLINTDTQRLNAYRTRRDKSRRMDDIEASVNNMQRDLKEIRDLIKIIVAPREA